ncbi:MAG: hypothetical protein ACH346_07635, partial [Chthoniobacterales bacterium]
MKTINKLLFYLAFLLSLSQLLAGSPFITETNIESNDITNKQITYVTAREYCDFLNQAGVTDAAHLYNQAMGSDPTTACIVRLREPGKFQYQVIAGRENILITYVNQRQQAFYCDWIKSASAQQPQVISEPLQEEESDDSLACNKNFFALESSSIGMVLLEMTSATDTTSSELSTAEEVGGVIGFLGMVALCPELMLRFSTLSDFRNAADHPYNADARRLIVQPDPLATGNNVIRAQPIGTRSENLETLRHLREALQEEHMPEDAGRLINSEISPLGLLTEQGSRVSTQGLKRILEAANNHRARVQNNPQGQPPSQNLTELNSLVHKAITADREEPALALSYKETDDHWKEADNLSYQRPLARWNVEAQELLRNEAIQVLEEQQAASDNRTLAKKIASILSRPLKWLNIPGFDTQQLANDLNEIVDLANKIPEGVASVRVAMAMRNLENAHKNAATIQEQSLSSLDQAQQEERAVRKHLHKKTLTLAQTIKPPLTVSEEDWKEWAQRIYEEKNRQKKPSLLDGAIRHAKRSLNWNSKSPTLSPLEEQLANQGVADPSWACDSISAAWRERITNSREAVRSLAADDAPDARELKRLNYLYDIACRRAVEDGERHQTLTMEWEHKWYEVAELEKEQRTLEEEQRRLSDIQNRIGDIKKHLFYLQQPIERTRFRFGLTPSRGVEENGMAEELRYTADRASEEAATVSRLKEEQQALEEHLRSLPAIQDGIRQIDEQLLILQRVIKEIDTLLSILTPQRRENEETIHRRANQLDNLKDKRERAIARAQIHTLSDIMASLTEDLYLDPFEMVTGDPALPIELSYSKLLANGMAPLLPWKKIAPGVLEKLNLVERRPTPNNRDNSGEEIEAPEMVVKMLEKMTQADLKIKERENTETAHRAAHNLTDKIFLSRITDERIKNLSFNRNKWSEAAIPVENDGNLKGDFLTQLAAFKILAGTRDESSIAFICNDLINGNT